MPNFVSSASASPACTVFHLLCLLYDFLVPVGGVQDFFIFVLAMKMNGQVKFNDQMIGQLCAMVDVVTADVREIVASGQYPVVVLLRAYDLLEVLQDAMPGLQEQDAMPELQERGVMPGMQEGTDRCAAGVAADSAEPGVAELGAEQKLQKALCGYREEFARSGQRLMEVLDREVIARKAQGYLRPWQRRFEKAQGEYRKAVELHEAAKVAHQAQMEGGLMERWRTLRDVRKLAGFRLERRRTGNYVARTLDLMQQAMLVAREAELAMYSHNIEYKCNPKVYMKINDLLTQKT